MRHHITAIDIAQPVCVAHALSELERTQKLTQNLLRKPSSIDKFMTITQFIEEQCQDPEFKELYQRKKMIMDIAQMMLSIRKKLGLNQNELAILAHTTQPVIARLESGNSSRLPSLDLLAKIAAATGSVLKIGFGKE